MTLYVCWGLFKTPRPGHPCRNAYDALRRAGHRPQIVRCYGWGLLPALLNRSRGRRQVQTLTGSSWVPVLVIEDEVVQGSREIIGWAERHSL